MNRVRVFPLDQRDLRSSYHLAVVTAGYETRSRHALESQLIAAQHMHAISFPDRHVLSYQTNVDRLRSLGCTIDEIGDGEVAEWMASRLHDINGSMEDDVLRVAVDVSSMSRTRIAAIIDTCRSIRLAVPLEVDFVYSLAQFTPPPTHFAPNAHVGPVIPAFAGWSLEPDHPPELILGLGYERDRALGAVEHLQPGAVWAFSPSSVVEEYAPCVASANATLIELLSQHRIIYYDVGRPFDCLGMIESLVFGIKERALPVLLPLGPKIFSVLCLLVACIHSPHVAVWRVSAGMDEEAVDRMPSGMLSFIRAVFGE